jgi:7-keto-8-aminopelargonate synthetase-like enzyme
MFFDRGFFVPAIRYPTVARGAARLRLTLSAAHEPEEIQAVTEALWKLA